MITSISPRKEKNNFVRSREDEFRLKLKLRLSIFRKDQLYTDKAFFPQ
jgi:hypothetical protein